MISRVLMVITLVGGLIYLYDKNIKPPPPPPPPPPKPPVIDRPPPQVVNIEELERVRRATKDADTHVRWAAIQLLVQLRDPEALDYLEEAMRIDTEPMVRKNALNLLKSQDHPERAMELVKALGDTEKDIRMAALMALADVGDPETTPDIVKLLNDTEAEVKTQALQTLGLIQAKQDAEHRQMQEEVRRAYEAALQQHKDEVEGRSPLSGLSTKHDDLLEKNKTE